MEAEVIGYLSYLPSFGEFECLYFCCLYFKKEGTLRWLTFEYVNFEIFLVFGGVTVILMFLSLSFDSFVFVKNCLLFYFSSTCGLKVKFTTFEAIEI